MAGSMVVNEVTLSYIHCVFRRLSVAGVRPKKLSKVEGHFCKRVKVTGCKERGQGTSSFIHHIVCLGHAMPFDISISFYLLPSNRVSQDMLVSPPWMLYLRFYGQTEKDGESQELY